MASRRGSPRATPSGLVSGHAAYGFFLATCIFFLTDNVTVSAIAILLAVMVAHIRHLVDRMGIEEGEVIQHSMITSSIERAQRKVEARNFDVRKQLLEYDDVSNDQRKVIYQQRNDILDASDLSAQINSLREGCFTDLVHQYVPAESVEEQWDITNLQKTLAEEWQLELGLQQQVQQASAITDEDILQTVKQAADSMFEAKVQLAGAEQFTQFERMVLLQSIDTHWRDHLSALDYLRQGIHLRGYAQKQPKQEYKREAFELFGQLLDSVKNDGRDNTTALVIQAV